MKTKHYALLICLLLAVTLAALYRSKVAAASPSLSINNIVGNGTTIGVDGGKDTAVIIATPEETKAGTAVPLEEQTPEEQRAHWKNEIRRLREAQIAERAARGENPTPEEWRTYYDNYDRRLKEERTAIDAADALAPPPDPRQVLWFSGYSRFRSDYAAPPPVWEGYYQYLLEKYADGNYDRALEEHDIMIRAGNVPDSLAARIWPSSRVEPSTREETYRIFELRDYGDALRWQSLREKYADWDGVRVKEEIDRFTKMTEHEWLSIPEERERHLELFSSIGVFRREYLLQRYADWDIGRAEEEFNRLENIRRHERQLAPEEYVRRFDLLHYIGILRYEAQDAPPVPAP